MKRLGVIILFTAGLCGSASAQSWTCSAPGMQSGTYDGGATAYIHLSAYSNGKAYPVVKKGKTASGKTSDGTPFTCVQK